MRYKKSSKIVPEGIFDQGLPELEIFVIIKL